MSPRFSIIPADAVDALEGLDLKVLLILGMHTDNRGWCRVNQKKLADRVGVARETVNRIIRRLCKGGFVEKFDTRAIGQNISTYRVVLDRGEPEPCDLQEITTPCDPDVTTPGGCDPSVTRVVTPKEITTQRPYSNERDSSPGAEGVTGHTRKSDPVEARRRALDLIELAEAERGMQEGWLGALFDFIVKRGTRPDIHEMRSIEQRSSDGARKGKGFPQAVLESSRRRNAGLLSEKLLRIGGGIGGS